jgi:hypothetical protein
MNDTPQRQDLPLPNYEQIPEAALPSHVSALSEADVAQLIIYEKAHGNRPPIMLILEKRLHDLQGGAVPRGPRTNSTPQVLNPFEPETAQAAQVPGRPIYPPSDGDPADPAQPGS